MAGSTPMSREGYRKVEEEVRALEAKGPELRLAIQHAREQGDLSENAAYHAAREDLAKLEAKLGQLRGQLASAEIIDESKRAGAVGRVVFGSSVKVKDLTSRRVDTYHLVGPGEVDVLENRILTTSPIGQALIAKQVGDEVEVRVPRGTLRLRIEEIS
jgi:transcription elongation factor GreA